MFSIKLQPTVLPNGKIIRGEEAEFETAAQLAEWYHQQMSIRKPRKDKRKKNSEKKEE